MQFYHGCLCDGSRTVHIFGVIAYIFFFKSVCIYLKYITSVMTFLLLIKEHPDPYCFLYCELFKLDTVYTVHVDVA